MKPKNKILSMTLFFMSSLLIIFCSDDNNPVVYDPDALRVAGKYKAVTFELPTNVDGSIDVLEIGGYINIELFPDFSVKGGWGIPETPDLNNSGFEESLEGVFTIKNGSLQFKGMNNILSHPSVFFIIKDDSLNAHYGGDPFPPIIIKLKKE